VTRPRAPTLERDLIEQALQKLFDNQKQIFLVELTTTLSPSPHYSWFFGKRVKTRFDCRCE